MKRTMTCVLASLLTLVAYGQSHSGTLGPGDATRDGGQRYDAYSFEIDGARHVMVRMESESFDTYLTVRSPAGIETSNDDYEGERVSQVELWATEAGTWTVWATQYSSDAEGAYSLDITLGDPAKVEVIQGRLDYADETALKGEYFDTHSWDSSSEDQMIIELLSLGFDGYLVVTSPSGEVWRNDDAGSTQLSRVGPVSGTGKWRVDVTSNSPDETGAYDLRLIVLPTVR